MWVETHCNRVVRRVELQDIIKVLDDLWLAVKCQSNSEIAGSPQEIALGLASC